MAYTREKLGAVAVVAGLIGAVGGVGGVEHSVTNSALLGGVLVSVCGLGLMYAGVKLIKGTL